mgnify:CR=1 FL=1
MAKKQLNTIYDPPPPTTPSVIGGMSSPVVSSPLGSARGGTIGVGYQDTSLGSERGTVVGDGKATQTSALGIGSIGSGANPILGAVNGGATPSAAPTAGKPTAPAAPVKPTIDGAPSGWLKDPARDQRNNPSGARQEIPGLNGGGGGQGGSSTPNNYEQQATDMWSGMMADYDASLGSKLDQTYADEARAGRKSDAISALSGAGVSGGGYQAGQAQVTLGGMAQRQDTMTQHTKQGLTMKLTYLDSLIKRAEASKDRALQERLQKEADDTLLLLQGSQIDPTDTTGGKTVPEGSQDPNKRDDYISADTFKNWNDPRRWDFNISDD